MKQLFIILLICTLPLTGCRSKKTAVKETTKLDAVETVEKTERERGAVDKIDKVVKDVKVSVADKTVTRTTETEYSAPDVVTGVQHKTKERITDIFNDIATLNELSELIISGQKETIERQSSTISELQTRLEAALSEKTKTTTHAPFGTYILTFAIGAIVALLTGSWIKEKFRFLRGKAF